MHLVILLLAALAFSLYLTLGVLKKPDQRKFLYLYLAIDIWLATVFGYLLFTALLD